MLKKYSDEVAGLANRIDLESQCSYAKTSLEIKDITSAAMDFDTTTQEAKWKVLEVALSFSNATARDFSISKKSVANIVFGRNDRFWLRVDGQTTTRVTLDEGIYDSTALAAEMETQLDAAFVDLGVTFTVSFTSGKFTITNSGSLDMTYIYVNEKVGTRRNSTLSANIGFTQDQGPVTSLVSDTFVDLDETYVIIAETGNTDTSYVLTDNVDMDTDSSLNISTGTAATTITAKVTYEKC